MTSISKFEWYLESDSEVSGANEEVERSETEVNSESEEKSIENLESQNEDLEPIEKIPKKSKKQKEIGQDRQCKFILISGKTKGQKCKTKSNVGKDFCSKHLTRLGVNTQTRLKN